MVAPPLQEARCSLRRLHVSRHAIAAGRATLDPGALHYLRDVLRLKLGAEIELFDGEGGVYPATWDGPEKGLSVGERREGVRVGVPIWLAFALSKGDKVDFVVQKATELGVARIIPFQAARSVVKIDSAKISDKQKRWIKIAGEAARQCGRADIPEVDPPRSLPALLRITPDRFSKVLFYEGGGESIGELVAREATGHIAVIGPEGGFTSEEVQLLTEVGFRLSSLGPRIMRAETAAVVAVTLLQHRYGDLA